nr:uncharacterized mitochondrial protein AtMg00810-like [Tanacetum cinerariifolium]
MSMMGEMTFFLGLQVNQSPRGISINQSKYVLEILKKYGMESCDPVGTPLEIKNKLDLDQNWTPVDATKYRSMIGALMYLTSIRPNIVHATCLCARYQAKPTEKHLKEVKRIFRYLRGTVNTGLWYSKDSCFELTGFSDADYAGCKDTFKSTSGRAQFLGEFDDLMPIIKEGKVIDEPMIDIIKTRNNESFDKYPSVYEFDQKIHIDCAYNLRFSCMIGFEHKIWMAIEIKTCEISFLENHSTKLHVWKQEENLAADHLSRLENLDLGTFTEEEIANKFPGEHLMILKTKLNEDEPCTSITGRKVCESVFFWPSILKYAKDYVMRCDAYQRSGNISSRKIEHKAYWELKQCNMDLTSAEKNHFMKLNELMELRDGAYKNTRIYKERTKRWHDSRFRGDKNFKVGDKVLLFNSRFKMHL